MSRLPGWMRVGYVAHSHDVPLPVLNQAIGLTADARDRRPLTEIARSQDSHPGMDAISQSPALVVNSGTQRGQQVSGHDDLRLGSTQRPVGN
jgi:hypothetical protein